MHLDWGSISCVCEGLIDSYGMPACFRRDFR